jgi:hypothetical protein
MSRMRNALPEPDQAAVMGRQPAGVDQLADREPTQPGQDLLRENPWVRPRT